MGMGVQKNVYSKFVEMAKLQNQQRNAMMQILPVEMDAVLSASLKFAGMAERITGRNAMMEILLMATDAQRNAKFNNVVTGEFKLERTVMITD